MPKKEKFNCEECGKYVEIDSKMFNKRPSGNGKKVCRKCYYDLFKSSTPVKKEKYPKVVQEILHKKVFEYDKIKDFIDGFKTKKRVRFKCMCCGSDEEMQINSMRRRKIAGTKPICRKCSLSYAISSDEWKKSNSDAQFIAQNREGVKEKQRKSQRDLIEKDPLYIEKRRSNNFISGKIENIYFDSSWELFYIVYCFENKNIRSINRFNSKIKYRDSLGKCRYYIPDFKVEFLDGSIKVIEIKGELSKNVDIKRKAAKEKFGLNYEMLKQKELYNLGLFVRSEPFIKEWYLKILDNYKIKFNKNKCTENIFKKIKDWKNEWSNISN